MAYEASQNGFRNLIVPEDDVYIASGIPNCVGLRFHPNYSGILSKLGLGDNPLKKKILIPKETWLKMLLEHIQDPTDPFAAYSKGKVRLSDPFGAYPAMGVNGDNEIFRDYSLEELKRVTDVEEWAKNKTRAYHDGGVEFVVYQGDTLRDADSWFVFSSREENGILLWLITQCGMVRAKQLVRSFVPEEQLDDVVRKLFRKFE